jgi:UDP-glucose 4-epimerase
MDELNIHILVVSSSASVYRIPEKFPYLNRVRPELPTLMVGQNYS